MNTWTLIFSALGLAMFIEGLPYFISPAGVRRYLEQVTRMRNGSLRVIGILLMSSGLLVAWLSLNQG